MRYLHPIALSQRVAHERLTRICFIDYDREMVLVAERAARRAGRAPDPGGGAPDEAALVRRRRSSPSSISDAFQQQGLGTELLRRLLDVGRREGLRRIMGYISAENTQMLKLATKLGFRTARLGDDPSVVEATVDL